LRERGFDWWVDRLRSALRRFHRVRLDHFLGFAACWATPAGEETARRGSWKAVPGEELLSTLRDRLGRLPIVAEDLGVISPEVIELRDRFGFPGMKILQFGFGGDRETNEHAPHNHVANCVVYTGTHDNETIEGWFHEGIARSRSPREAERERRFMLAYTGGEESEIHWNVIRVAMMSVADTVVIPMQDLLGLGNEARMNRPGEAGGNWVWRMREDEWTPEVGKRLADLTLATGRWPDAVDKPHG
jgi:4-alpha-glucanotransferase